MERAASSGIAKAGPRRCQRAHRRCVREQLRSRAAVALRWLEAGGSEEHLRDGSTFTLPDRVEELFGSASRTSPLACKGDVRGPMRELTGEMLRQAPPEPLRFQAPLPAHHFGGVWGLHQHALRFRSPGAAGLGSGCQAATLAQRSDCRSRHFRPRECTEGLLCGQSTGVEEDGAPHDAVRVGAEPARKQSATSLCFAVKKDEHADRLIGDRRPLNAGERQPGPPKGTSATVSTCGKWSRPGWSVR